MKFFKKYIRKYWLTFSIAVFFLTIEAVCDLLQPTMMAHMIDFGVSKRDLGYVLHTGGIMLLITLVGAIAASMRNILASIVSQSFGTELRSDLYRKIQSFSFRNIDRFDRASLITRLTNDVTQVQVFVNGTMRIFVKSPLLSIGGLIMAIQLDLRLSVVLVVVVPVVSFLIIVNMKMGFPLFAKVQKALDQVNRAMREYLSGVRVVKAFNRFDVEEQKFEAVNEELMVRSMNAMRTMSIFGPAIMLTMNLGIVAVLWFGGIGTTRGMIPIGHIVAFINYMTQILFSLMMVSMVFTMFVRAKASAGRIGEVFTVENEMHWEKEEQEKPDRRGEGNEDREYEMWEQGRYADGGRQDEEEGLTGKIKRQRHWTGNGSVTFEDVSFSYEAGAEEPALQSISFHAHPGDRVGIIGPTGSGKTTLVQLIPRFYDATSGRVKVNGVDVRRINPEILRESIAIVPQKATLFTGTIEENLRWGKEEASLEEIIEAARIAEAHDFISSFPEGYRTWLGQGGVNLSGGQKQRLTIARALIRRPEILILDDSTSAVDVTTEGKIKASLNRVAKGLTTFMIAQRITSVMDADQILVLEGGRLVGQGKHEELLASCNVYREIYQTQMGKEATSSDDAVGKAIL